MPLADCGKCWLAWDADSGQFDLMESSDCPIHGWDGYEEENEESELRED